MDTIKPISRQLADFLAQGGVFLAPKTNSVIAPLTEALVDMMPTEQVESSESLRKMTNATFESLRPNIFLASLEDNNDDEPEFTPTGIVYDEVVAKAIEELKPIVENVISDLKGTILPAVKSIFDKAYEVTADAVDTGSVKLSVRTNYSEKAIWTNSTLLSLLAATEKGNGIDKVAAELTFPVLSPEVLGDLIKTGDPVFDAEVLDYLKEFSLIELIEHTYNEIFNPPSDIRHPGQGKLPEALVAFLLAKRFEVDIPEGVAGMELDDYRAQMRKVARHYAYCIDVELQRFDTNRQTGYLIVSLPAPGAMFNDSDPIIVDGMVYERYLELGGGVDGIYGSYVSNRSRQMTDILENHAKLEREWHNQVALAQSAKRDDFQRIFIAELRRQVYLYANEHGMKADEKEIDVLYDTHISVDPQNAYEFARKHAIKALWKDTEYLTLVCCIDAVCAKYEEIEFDDAVELGIIDWLVKWALEHVQIVKA